MAHIEWDESYSVHNAAIDEQHKKWIAIFNKLHAVMLDANTDSLADITTESLSAMHDYARSHFHFEEKYMEQLGYPHLIEHRRLHRDFENQVYNYIRQIEAGTLILNTSLLKVIKNWLLEHILSEDKKYSIFAHDAIVPGT